jgi:Leucine-rich repeat (LRR) protein
MRGDPIFNAGLDIERTRQRYSLAEMYCELQGDDWADRQQFLAPVDECDWFTTITEDICDMEGIIEILRLPENNMVGTMPPELSMMSSLEEITFESNSMQGSVPEDYATMSSLRSLDLSSNALDGPIPEFVWDLTPLEVLDLSNNGFTGFIPAIIMTENLRILSLSNNKMNGEIPALFGLLNWNILHLDNNQFSGTIPPDLSSPDIQELLLHNNQLTGTFPADDFVSSEDFAELLTTVMINGNTLIGDVNSMCVLIEDGALETFVVDPGVTCDCCQPAT